MESNKSKTQVKDAAHGLELRTEFTDSWKQNPYAGNLEALC